MKKFIITAGGTSEKIDNVRKITNSSSGKLGMTIANHILTEDDDCFIYNDGTHAYECHPEYKFSLFVNTARPNEKKQFSVLDYEVYTY